MRIFRIIELARIGLSRVPKTPEPKELVMKIINDCNFHCKYCFTRIYLNERIQKALGLKMRPDDAAKILEDAWELGCRKASITGLGEPSIHPNFYQYLSLAKDIGYKVVVSTNGWGINPSRLDMLDERDRIQYSIDKMHIQNSPDPKIYLKKMMFQLDKSNSKNYNIRVRIHGESTPGIDKMLRETGVKVAKYSLLKDSSIVTPAEKPSLVRCTYPWYTLSVCPDLKIDPCCSAQGYTVGEVKEGRSLRDVWYGDSMNAFRYKVLSNDPPHICMTCERVHRGVMDWLGAYLNTYWIEK